METAKEVRVLVVEDSEVDSLIIKRFLLRSHAPRFQLKICQYIRDAVEALRLDEYDALLLDMGLPDGSGLGLIDVVREANSTIPIVIMTGNEDDELAISALRRGAQDYVLKQDLSTDQLRRALRYSIERHSLAQELELANRKLLVLTEKAESASRKKSEFLANMSHEIRTPLTAILGFSDLLRSERQSLSEEVIEDALWTVQQNGEHLLILISDILDFSKIEAGYLSLECMPFNPRKCVVDCVDLMKIRAQEKNLALIAEISPELPEYTSSDPTRIRQILLNLICNAIKFTTFGEVRVIAAYESGQLKLSVEDTGIGIANDRISELFQSFVKADSPPAKRFGGTGLGLAISRRLAQMLDGELTVESEPDSGSVFSLSIPAPIANPQAEDVSGGKAQSDDKPINRLRECRVLVVEDSPDNQRLIELILRRGGCHVTIAKDGQQAIDLASNKPFDLVFMDLQMPNVDGLEATKVLRTSGYDRPIIALTANATDEDRRVCMEAGCDDYAAKPILREKLIAIAERWSGQTSVSKPMSHS